MAPGTGLGQVVFTSVFGFLICLELGLDLVTIIQVAVALSGIAAGAESAVTANGRAALRPYA